MLGLSFLHPYALAALAAVAVPIIIHLWGRQRAPEILFPSLRLLQQAQRRTSRFVRLRQLLVLLLRMLIIALLVLAFAGPISSGGCWLAPRRTTALLLLDDSSSMALRQGTRTSFDLARRAAARIMQSLSAGDEAALLVTSAAEMESQPGPTRSPAAVARQLERLAVSDVSARLDGGMAAAADLLAQAGTPGGAVFVLTDCQATAFGASAGAARDLPENTALFIVDVGPAEWRNTGWQDLQLLTNFPLPGRPVTVRATLHTHGWEAGRRVAVSLTADGKPQPGRTVTAQQPGPSFVQFQHVFASAGEHWLAVGLPPDDLPGDDRRYLSLVVRPSAAVLVVETPAKRRPSEFLVPALNPPLDARGDRADILRPKVVAPSELSADRLAAADLVIWADVPTCDAATAQALGDFVRRGGGLLVLLGSAVEPATYNSVFLPAICAAGRITIGERSGDPSQRERYFAITEFDTSGPPLAAFAEPQAGDLSSIHFFARWDLHAPGATVRASFDDGSPALVETSQGQGRVAVLSLALDPAWSDAPQRAVFVPLVHRLAYHLARGATRAIPDLATGREIALTLSGAAPSRRVRLRRPGGVEQQRPIEPGARRLRLGPARRRGIYDLAVEEGGTVARHVFAANTPTPEFDLTKAPPEAIRRWAGRPVRILPVAKLAELSAAALPRSADLAVPLLVLAALLLAVESALSLSRRRSAKPAAE